MAQQPGRPRRRAMAGFTLVELMVVVVIVGVVAGAVLIGFTGSDRRQAVIGEAERMAALLRLARDEALLQPMELGLRSTRDGYEFLAWDVDTGTWRIVTGGRNPLRPRTLPPGLRLRIVTEDLPTLPGAGQGTGPVPELLILSSGDVTPFEATVETEPGGGPGIAWLVVGDGVHDAVALSPDEAEDLGRQLVRGMVATDTRG